MLVVRFKFAGKCRENAVNWFKKLVCGIVEERAVKSHIAVLPANTSTVKQPGVHFRVFTAPEILHNAHHVRAK